MEVFKSLAIISPYYEVSNLGRVRLIKAIPRKKPCGKKPLEVGCFLKQFLVKGYPNVPLKLPSGKYRNFAVSRLMCFAFYGPPPGEGRYEAAHKDGDSCNNNISNLYWATPRENTTDKLRHNTQVKGVDVHTSKLTPTQVVSIFREYHVDKVPQPEIARRYGVTQGCINKICTKRSWKSVPR